MQPMVLGDEVLDAVDYEDLTIDNTGGGVTLTATKIQPSAGLRRKAVRITFETAELRFRHDGGAPTTTVGHRANDGDVLALHGTNNLLNFKAIRTGGTSATARVTYFQ